MRYPYHRYLRYLVLNGDGAEEIRDNLVSLEYIPPRDSDVTELINIFRTRVTNVAVREREGVTFFDDACKSLDQVFWIVETPVIRSCVERLLLDKVQPNHIATILGLKFSHDLTVKAVNMFRDGFWDTGLLGPVDFTEYFSIASQVKPEPPPDSVSLATRAHYSAWKAGLHPDPGELSVEDMVREIGVDSFMRYKELSSRPGVDSQKLAMAHATMVLKTAPAAKSLRALGGGRGNEVPHIKPLIEYPSGDVPTISDLHRDYAEEQSGTGGDIDALGLDRKK